MARLSMPASRRMRRRMVLVAVLGAALAICATTLPLAPTADTTGTSAGSADWPIGADGWAQLRDPIERAAAATQSTPPAWTYAATTTGAALAWTACTETALAGFDCGTLTVPLDWDSAGAQRNRSTVDIAVARHASTGTPQERIGSLFFNVGGPGLSGISSLPMMYGLIPAEVKARFDIVTWDPRGIGRSSGLQGCDDAVMPLPATGPVNWTRVYEKARAAKAAANRACAAASANMAIINHMGTVAIVRDLDALRAAVGDPKLTYWAMSYGTRIGYTYALRYPAKVRAIILDGSIDPNGSIEGLAQSEVSADTALGFLFQLYPGAQTQYASVRAELDRRVIALPSGRIVTRWGFSGFLGEYAGSESSYGALARLVGYAHTALFGTGSAVEAALAVLDGVPFEQSISLGSAAFAVVNCADYPQRPTIPAQNALARSLRLQAPVHGWLNAFADVSMCSGLRVPVEPVPVDFGQLAVPVLIIGSTRDAHTPYAWTVSMTRAFTSSRVVTYVGGKHVDYGAAQSACVDDAVGAYLLDLALPEFDIACQAEAPALR